MWGPRQPLLDPQRVIRPLCAGAGILNTGSGELGTIGLIATSDGIDRWLVSCYHVLARPYVHGTTSAWSHGDAFVQPLVQPDGQHASTPLCVVGPSNVRGLSERDFDIAAIQLPTSVPTSSEVLNLTSDGTSAATLRGVASPAIGMRVIKSGRSTGVTLGEVVALRPLSGGGVAVEVAFDVDELANQLTAPGDSGAAWIDRSTGMAVALHQGATSRGGSQAIALPEALARLGLVALTE